jgi:hypothetical protein
MSIKVAGPYVEEHQKGFRPFYYRRLIMSYGKVGHTQPIMSNDGGKNWMVRDFNCWSDFPSIIAAQDYIDEWLIRIGVKIVSQEEFDKYLVLL